VPTIAVATAGGTSVIKDDGIVVDVMTSNSYGVAFTKNYELINTVNDASGTFSNHIREIPSADTNTAATRRYFRAGNNTGTIPSISGTSGEATANILAALPNNTLAVATNGTAQALNILQEVPTAPTTGMIAYIASDYNTGWMNGDIKLATLSDTDTADVTGAELVTNGTFASNVTGWTSLRSAVLSHSSGAINVTNASGVVSGMASQAVTLEVGKTYIYQVTRVSGSRPGYSRIGTTPTGGFYIANTLSSGTSSNTFVATSTTAYISLQINGGSDGDNVVFDNVSVRLAEPDRSVNGNGVQAFGTITKTAVATGADLVGYSGFSASNYLEQPYNSDLDFGTGDFSFMVWVKPDSTSSGQYVFQLNNSDGSKYIHFLAQHSSASLFNATGTAYISNGTQAPAGVWSCYCGVRRGNILELYLDGNLVSSVVSTAGDVADGTSTLTIGNRDSKTSAGAFNGNLALFRISATEPSAEQIAKIYNDEKQLFATNAKATLYGTSDAVTALAYDDDTELLHVGTSAGRSVFQGLNRVDNTTDAVGAAISASNGLVAED
jgi:hypothetical protein